MNKQLIIGLCFGGLLATAGGAFALRGASPKVADIISIDPITAGMEQQYAEVLSVTERIDPNGPRFADVTDSRAITQPGRQEEVCEDVVVTRKAPVKDQHQVAGTATGAVVGGVLGNQVGNGNGKKVATVAGAILGGIVGKKVQANQQDKNTYQTTERQCRTERGEDQITGYDVTYTLDGATDTVRLDYKPGRKLPVLNGELITDQQEAERLAKREPPKQFDVIYRIGGVESSAVLPRSPRVGEMLIAQNGEVVTDPSQLASIQANQHKIVAYRVKYRIKDELGEARLIERPVGSTLQVKNGQVIMANAGGNNTIH